MMRQKNTLWIPFLLLVLAAPACAQTSTGMVFPGEEWERIGRGELETSGWSPEGLQQASAFLRDSANTTGLDAA